MSTASAQRVSCRTNEEYFFLGCDSWAVWLRTWYMCSGASKNLTLKKNTFIFYLKKKTKFNRGGSSDPSLQEGHLKWLLSRSPAEYYLVSQELGWTSQRIYSRGIPGRCVTSPVFLWEFHGGCTCSYMTNRTTLEWTLILNTILTRTTWPVTPGPWLRSPNQSVFKEDHISEPG